MNYKANLLEEGVMIDKQGYLMIIDSVHMKWTSHLPLKKYILLELNLKIPFGCDKTQNKGFLSCDPFWGPFMKISDFGQIPKNCHFNLKRI